MDRSVLRDCVFKAADDLQAAGAVPDLAELVVALKIDDSATIVPMLQEWRIRQSLTMWSDDKVGLWIALLNSLHPLETDFRVAIQNVGLVERDEAISGTVLQPDNYTENEIVATSETKRLSEACTALSQAEKELDQLQIRLSKAETAYDEEKAALREAEREIDRLQIALSHAESERDVNGEALSHAESEAARLMQSSLDIPETSDESLQSLSETQNVAEIQTALEEALTAQGKLQAEKDVLYATARAAEIRANEAEKTYRQNEQAVVSIPANPLQFASIQPLKEELAALRSDLMAQRENTVHVVATDSELQHQITLTALRVEALQVERDQLQNHLADTKEQLSRTLGILETRMTQISAPIMAPAPAAPTVNEAKEAGRKIHIVRRG